MNSIQPNNILDSLSFLKLFKKTGHVIDELGIEQGETEYDDVNKKHKLRCLGNCFDNKQYTDQYFFGYLNNHCEDYYFYELTLTPTEIEKLGFKNKNNQGWYRYHDSHDAGRQKNIKKALNYFAEPAGFGDVMKGETKVDQKIRQGKSILLDNNRIKVDNDLLYGLETMFSTKTNIANIKVVPYKMNIYHKGDFFKPHLDSPEKDLIGTIIVVVNTNKSAYNCFKINGEMWTQRKGNCCLFYTDTEHEILPVKGYRETLTFKVFATNDYKFDRTQYGLDNTVTKKMLVKNTGLLMDLANEIEEYCKRPLENILADQMNFNSVNGILLQNGYGVDILNDINWGLRLKGKDRLMFDTLNRSKTNKLRIIPVIIKHLVELDLNYYNDSDGEGYEDAAYDEYEKVKYQSNIKAIEKECSGHLKELKYFLGIYQISKEMTEELQKWNIKVNVIDDQQKIDVYYMGLGYEIGKVIRKNFHIGNQSSGHSIKDIYFNLMMMVEQKN